MYRYVEDAEFILCMFKIQYFLATNEGDTKEYFDECDHEFFRLCEDVLKKIETFFSG